MTIANATDQVIEGARLRQRRYGALQRRNLIINILRIGVPVAGVLVATLVAGQAMLGQAQLPVSAQNISIQAGRLVIDAPRYAGKLSDGTIYEVIAGNADVALDDTDLFSLAQARVETLGPDGYAMTALAEQSALDLDAGTVYVPDILEVSDSDGVSGFFTDSLIDWSAQTLVAQGPVELNVSDGSRINAFGTTYEVEAGIWQFSDVTYEQEAELATEQQMQISASQLVYDRDGLVAQLKGNAELYRPDLTLKAAQMVVQFDQTKAGAIASLVAQDNMRVEMESQTILAERGEYNAATHLFVASGSVRVDTQNGTITAPQLELDTADGASHFSGGSQAVKANFTARDAVAVIADRFDVSADGRQAVFAGNVLVNQPDIETRANRLTVFMGGDGNQISHYQLAGNVRINDGDMIARGDQGRYDPFSRLLRLTGNVVVTENGSTISASELTVDFARNLTTFGRTGGQQTPVSPDDNNANASFGETSGGRVTGVFSTQN